MRRFPALDGLRAVAALLVVFFHYAGPEILQGWIGVQMFFVVSGFLITALMIREEDRTGRLAVRDFYLRRFFRIVPVYLVVLAATVLVTIALGTYDSSGLAAAMPYHLTFFNEFTENNPYGLSWSLGIEQKFYLIWPLVFLVAAGFVRRFGLTVGAVAIGLAVAPLTSGCTPPDVSLNYVSILVGCALAMVMHHPRGFAVIRPLTRPGVAVSVAVAAVVAQLSVGSAADALNGRLGLPGFALVKPCYALVIAVLIPAVVANGPVRRALTWRPLVFIGERSYSLYLVQNLAAMAVFATLPWPPSIIHAIVVSVVALAVAHVLHRTVEQPMIRYGRRLTRPAIAPEHTCDAGKAH